MLDSTKRFSSRVDNYIRYRPGYPSELMAVLAKERGLRPTSLVADLGSGTGIFAEMFLANGNEVWGVEPNREMREAAERLLAKYPRFHSVEGAAEATTLEGASVDFVVAGQAFHWFDRARAKVEFSRILRPSGWIALVWNDRKLAATPFLEAYERLLMTYGGAEYTKVAHEHDSADIVRSFFEGSEFETRVFENAQTFDLEGLEGRLLSTSYTPEEGHPDHPRMLADLRAIFRAHQKDGRVVFEYDTRLFCGRLSKP